MNVTICVSTFGNYKWQLLAQQRALPSAYSFKVPVIYKHGNSLHEARNFGLHNASTEFICFLDADDELEPGFFDHMELVEGDLRVPSVRYVPYKAKMPNVVGHTHKCVADCLEVGNWLVVGTVARTELLRAVGGWKDYPVYEDFDLWQRCWLAGAIITPVPKSVYVAHSTPSGRNKSITVQNSRLIQYEFSKINMPDKDWEWLKK